MATLMMPDTTLWGDGNINDAWYDTVKSQQDYRRSYVNRM